MIIEDIRTYLGTSWDNCLNLMRKSLGSDVSMLDRTNESLLNNSGKMLRPMLSLLVGKACGVSNADTERIAASVELLHNATLMHDDVVDDSLERRGRPTLKSILGPSAAVLVGDFWLAKAMEHLLDCEESCKESALRLFGQTMVDLSEGEMLQMEKASEADTTQEDYLKIVYCKTASLFVAACVAAAVSVGASDEYVDAVRNYAGACGIAFQIQDDILDYCGDETLGKPCGIDLLEHKITLPLLCALEGSERQSQIRKLVRCMDDAPDNLAVVHDFVKANDGAGKAAVRLDGFIDRAVHALDVIPDSKAKDYLIMTARYIGDRRR